MEIDGGKLLNFLPKEEDVTYAENDVILYALGIGLGFEPSDERQLRFLYERDLVALPTFAMALGHPGWWLGKAGLDPARVVHAGKRIEVLAPLPPRGTVYTKSIVTGVTDKGPGKAALIHTQRDIWDKKTGAHLSRQINTIMARGQGGFGGENHPSAPPPQVPTREPDFVCDLQTLPQQALLYRLCGDRHPFHVDPEFARANGFAGPILHGLASMAIAWHAVLRTVCGYDTSQTLAIECRFTGPVFPGDLIRTEMWKHDNSIFFRSMAASDLRTVIDNGRVDLNSKHTQ